MNWKLVPLEPTPEMLVRGQEQYVLGHKAFLKDCAGVEDIYKTMLEAAPAAPVEQFEMDWPEYHAEAMGCGLEDRNITDRYDAMQYGWDKAIERCAERLPEELYTAPAAPVKCDGNHDGPRCADPECWNDSPAAPVELEPVAYDEIKEWMYREMPPGTVIGDPGWWASRIYTRFIHQAAPKPAPVELEQVSIVSVARVDVGEVEAVPTKGYVLFSDAAAVITAKDVEIENAQWKHALLEQQLAAMTNERDTFAAAGHRLAIELECLLGDCKDMAIVSKWSDSAMEAVSDWQDLFPYNGPRLGD